MEWSGAASRRYRRYPRRALPDERTGPMCVRSKARLQPQVWGAGCFVVAFRRLKKFVCAIQITSAASCRSS